MERPLNVSSIICRFAGFNRSLFIVECRLGFAKTCKKKIKTRTKNDSNLVNLHSTIEVLCFKVIQQIYSREILHTQKSVKITTYKIVS